MMAESNHNNNKQHLRELLKEDQEPFFLKDYIADRRSQLKSLQLKKIRAKPTMTPYKQKNFPGKFRRNACFFSSSSSPDVRKSPLFEFPSPVSSRSPLKSPKNNPILLHVPARTASLLLEAALRIQKQSSAPNKLAKAQIKSPGLGLFGSLLKRLTLRNRKREIILTSKEKPVLLVDEISTTSTVSSSSSSSSSSTSYSKCLDLETSSSSCSSSADQYSDNHHASGEMEFVRKLVMRERDHFCDDEDILDEFCDQSPFRFVLQRSPSSSHRTPEFSSPATSPCRHRREEKESYLVESSKEFQIEEEEEEEEEKEQFSPVSVLDPPFEDDYDGRDNEDEDEVFDLESSYAIVQRTKNQLLKKLRRFERLAELDPIELEKRMQEDEDEDGDGGSYHFGNLEGDKDCDDFDSNASDGEAITLDGFVRGVLNGSSFHRVHQAPEHMKRLVSNLIVEESAKQNHIEEREEEIVRRVCKRFESWNDVQSNTIDMMVEQDFRRELEGWKSNKEQTGETAVEIELAIFGLLVEELAEELVCCSGI